MQKEIFEYLTCKDEGKFLVSRFLALLGGGEITVPKATFEADLIARVFKNPENHTIKKVEKPKNHNLLLEFNFDGYFEEEEEKKQQVEEAKEEVELVIPPP